MVLVIFGRVSGTDMVGTPSDSTVTEVARRRDLQHFRVVMIFLAIVTVSAAFVLRIFHNALHLTIDEARDVASLFLIVGVIDTLVLVYWGRLFDTSSDRVT
jgi:hypothetical protein